MDAALWRRAGEPVAAHDIAAGLLGQERYERTRGVAQQAARLARAARLDRVGRRRLLAAAWLHDLGDRLGPGLPALEIGRALRRAGQEPLARIVAHAGNAPLAAALLDLPPIAREFRPPRGGDARIVTLLDIASVATGADGAPGTPVDALRERASRAPGGVCDPSVRVLVDLVARLGEDAASRALLERIARGSA